MSESNKEEPIRESVDRQVGHKIPFSYDPYGTKGINKNYVSDDKNEILVFHHGIPGRKGPGGRDHYHIRKSNEEGGYDYVDKSGNVVPLGSDASYLYNIEEGDWT